MITEKHLAIVRAALQYFDEEMSPHGDSFRSYLDESGKALRVGNTDINETRELFANLIPRQAMLDTESNRFSTKQHFACGDVAGIETPARRIKYVTILIPGHLMHGSNG